MEDSTKKIIQYASGELFWNQTIAESIGVIFRVQRRHLKNYRSTSKDITFEEKPLDDSRKRRILFKNRLERLEDEMKRVLKFFSSYSLSFLAKTLNDGVALICGKYYKNFDFSARCFECCTDSSCVMCMPCFLRSPCRYHKHKYRAVVHGGGMCDCGDSSSWRTESFCSFHRSSIDGKRDPLAHLSSQDKHFFSLIARGAVQTVAYTLLSLLQEYKLRVKNGRMVCKGKNDTILVPHSLSDFVAIIRWLSEAGSAGKRLLANAWSEVLDPCFCDEGTETREKNEVITDSHLSLFNSSSFGEVSIHFDNTVVSAFPVHSALDVFFLFCAFRKRKFCFDDFTFADNADEESDEDSSEFDDLADSEVNSFTSADAWLSSSDNEDKSTSSQSDDLLDDVTDEEEVVESKATLKQYNRILELLDKADRREEKMKSESGRALVDNLADETVFFLRVWDPISQSIKNCMSDEVFRLAYGMVQMKYFYTSPSEEDYIGIQVLGNGDTCEDLLHSSNFPLTASISGDFAMNDGVCAFPARHQSEKEYRRLRCIQRRSHDNILLRFVGSIMYRLSFPSVKTTACGYQYPTTSDDIDSFTIVPTLPRGGTKVTIENEGERFPLLNVNFHSKNGQNIIRIVSSFQSSLTCSSLVSTIPAVSRLTLRGIVVFLCAIALWTPISAKADETSDIPFFFRFMAIFRSSVNKALTCITQQIFHIASELGEKETRFPNMGWSRRNLNHDGINNFLEAIEKDFVDEMMEAEKLDDISFPHLPTKNFRRVQRLISLQEGENPFLCFYYKSHQDERRERVRNGEDSGVSHTEKIRMSTSVYILEVLQEIWRGLELIYDAFFFNLLKISDKKCVKKDKKKTATRAELKAHGPTANPLQRQARRDKDNALDESLNSDAALASVKDDFFLSSPNEGDGDTSGGFEKNNVEDHVLLSGMTCSINTYDISKTGAQSPLLPHNPVEHFFANVMTYAVCFQAAHKEMLLEKYRENVVTPQAFWRTSCCWKKKCSRAGMATETSSSSFLPSIDETKGEGCTVASSSLKTAPSPFFQEEEQVPFIAHCSQKYLDCLMDSLVIKFAWGAQVESEGWGGLFHSTVVNNAFEGSEEHYLFLIQLLASVYSPTYFSSILLDRFTCASFSLDLQYRVYEKFLWLICSIVISPLPISLDRNSMQSKIRMLSVHALCAKPLKRSDVHKWVTSKFSYMGLQAKSVLVYSEIENALSEVAVSSGAYLKVKNPEVWRQFANLYHYSIRDFVLEEVSRSYEHLVMAERVEGQTTKARGDGESSAVASTSGEATSLSSPEVPSPFSDKPEFRTSIPPVEFHYGKEEWKAPSWHFSRLNLLHTAAVQRICFLLILNHAGKLKDWHYGSKVLRYFSSVNSGSVGFEKGFLTALHLLYLSVKDAALISKELTALKQCGVGEQLKVDGSNNSTDSINWEFVSDFIKENIRSPRCRFMSDEKEENEAKEKEVTFDNVSLFLEVKGNKGEWKWKSATASTKICTLPQLLLQPIFVKVENEFKDIQMREEESMEKVDEDHFTLGAVLFELQNYYLNKKEADRFSYSIMIQYILEATQYSREMAAPCYDVVSASPKMTKNREKMEYMKSRRALRMMKFLRKRQNVALPLSVSATHNPDESANGSGEPSAQTEKRWEEEEKEGGMTLANAPELVDCNEGDSSKLLSVKFMDLLLFKISTDRCILCQRTATSQEPLYLFGNSSHTDVLTRLGYNTTSLTCHFSICGHKAHFACLRKLPITDVSLCVLCKAKYFFLLPVPLSPCVVRMEKGEYQSMNIEVSGNTNDTWNWVDKDLHEIVPQNLEGETGNSYDAMEDENNNNDFLPKKNKRIPIIPFCEELEAPAAFSTSAEGQSSSPSRSNTNSSFHQKATYLSFSALLSSAPSSSSVYLPLSSLEFIPPFSYDLNSVDFAEEEEKSMLKNFMIFIGSFQVEKNAFKPNLQSKFFLKCLTTEEPIVESFFQDPQSNYLESLATGISQQIQLKMEHLKLNGTLPEKTMETLFPLLVSVNTLCCSYLKENKDVMKEKKSFLFSEWKRSLANLAHAHQHFARLILYIFIDNTKRCLYGQESGSTPSHKAVDDHEHSFFSPEKNIEAFTLALLESDAMKDAVEEVLQYSSLVTPSPNSESVRDTREELFQSEGSSFPSISEGMISLWCSLGSLTILKLLTTWGSNRCSSVVSILWAHSSQGKFTVKEMGELANFKFITLSGARQLFSHYFFLLEAIMRMMYFLLPLEDVGLPRMEGSTPMKDTRVGSIDSHRWVHECLLRLNSYICAQRVMRKEIASGAASSHISLRYGYSPNFSIVPVASFPIDVPNAFSSDRKKREIAPLSSSRFPSARSNQGYFSLLSWKQHIMKDILHFPQDYITIIQDLYFGDSFDEHSNGPLTTYFPPTPENWVEEGLPVRCCFCQTIVPALRVVDGNFKLNPLPLFSHALECSCGTGIFLLIHFGILVLADEQNKSLKRVCTPYLNELKDSAEGLVNGIYSRDSDRDDEICQSWVLNQWKTL